MKNKIKLPITVEWNKARKQWDVLFLGSHLQEIDEDATQVELFQCSTVKSFADKLNLKKDVPNKLTLIVY